jgi:NAD(P)-dependent dehydrogenase (short-subunit alcohol dehydrogenase family)
MAPAMKGRRQFAEGGNMQDVEGKTAFITGGASGIGFGMARAFLKAGMKVVMADIRQDHLDEAAAALKGSNLPYHFIRLDVTDRAAFAAAADETERVFGKVHLVCNNAGVGGNAPIEEADYEDWDWVVGVNFGGVINGVKTFVPRIKRHGEGGHIVNTSSMAGIIPLTSQGGIYSASKFATRGLTDSLRLALGKYGIGVSVLCPGLVHTNIMDAEKSRPAHLKTAAQHPPRHLSKASSASAGMNPLEMGERVLRGIRRNDAYILTHGEFKDEVAGLFKEILDSFPTDDDIDPGRLEFENIRRAMTEEAKAQARKVK